MSGFGRSSIGEVRTLTSVSAGRVRLQKSADGVRCSRRRSRKRAPDGHLAHHGLARGARKTSRSGSRRQSRDAPMVPKGISRPMEGASGLRDHAPVTTECGVGGLGSGLFEGRARKRGRLAKGSVRQKRQRLGSAGSSRDDNSRLKSAAARRSELSRRDPRGSPKSQNSARRSVTNRERHEVRVLVSMSWKAEVGRMHLGACRHVAEQAATAQALARIESWLVL